VIPIYLAILLLLRAMKTLAGLVRPWALLLPEALPGEKLLSLLLVLLICTIVGAVTHTPAGRAARETIEKRFFERIPGYALIRSLTQRMAGKNDGNVWQPALVEIEEALVPGFIVEYLDDGRYTVFVPSIPTPLAGAIYVLDPARVHPVDVPFTDALRTISRWGAGAKNLVAAMPAGSRMSG
jgi:uncharacterized membrane protein